MASNLTFDTAIIELFDDCAEIGHLLAMKGWAEASGGNLSVRIPSTIDFTAKKITELKPARSIPLQTSYLNLENQLLLIKATGKRLREVGKAPSKILGIGLIRKQVLHILWPDDKTFQPTSELPTHLAIQNYLAKNKPNLRAVLHAHPTELIAISFFGEKFLTTINETLWSVNPGALLFLPEGVGVVTFKPPASQELAKETVALIAKHRLILWAKHGCLSVGKTLAHCFDLMEIANKSAEIFLKAKYFPGVELEKLSKEDLENIKREFTRG